MTGDFSMDDLLFIEQCRAGRAPAKTAGRRRRPRSLGPMTDEERRESKRDYQRRRREDPWEREKDRSYARDHYCRNREKRLRQMKEYQQRLKREKENHDENPKDGQKGGLGDGGADGGLPALGAG